MTNETFAQEQIAALAQDFDTSPLTVAEVAALADQAGRKFTADDVDVTFTVTAMQYVADYRGTFGFLIDVQRAMFGRRDMRLSPGQVKGVLNCMAAEGRRNRPAEAPTMDVNGANLADYRGYFATTMQHPIDGDDILVEFAIDDDFRADAGPNTAMLKVEADGRFEGAAFINGDQVRVWKRYQNSPKIMAAVEAISGATEDQMEASGMLYANSTNRCRRCRRPLTVATSIHRGYGPDCAEMVGA